jgi:putative heme iron utilization protein
VKDEAAARAAQLVRDHRVAALGTMHAGAPSVTMVPFAFVVEPLALVVLVSALASHTADMRAERRVGVLVAEPESEASAPHQLARVSMQAQAHVLASDDAQHEAARRAYAARFPDMTGLFALADFALFAIEPVAVRVVAGFAQAASITPQRLESALRSVV